jgi:hypothetical protein
VGTVSAAALLLGSIDLNPLNEELVRVKVLGLREKGETFK